MHVTNKILLGIFNAKQISQSRFGKIISFSQPYVLDLLRSNNELRFSELQRIGKLFNLEYEIHLKSDENDFEFNLINELQKLEIKLINQFSKETDYEAKKILDKKIEAIKILLDT